MADSVNYTVVVQVPLPFVNLSLNFDTIGGLIAPAMTALGIPKALSSLLGGATELFQNVIEDAQDLILAIPDATVTIQVKIGPVVLYNVILVAEKVPMVITPPTFQLALPNFAVDGELSVGAVLPGSQTIIRIPIPVPVINPIPLLGISGGQVSATGGIGTGFNTGSSAAAGGGAGGAAVSSGGGGVAVGPSVTDPTTPFTVVTDPIDHPQI